MIDHVSFDPPDSEPGLSERTPVHSQASDTIPVPGGLMSTGFDPEALHSALITSNLAQRDAMEKVFRELRRVRNLMLVLVAFASLSSGIGVFALYRVDRLEERTRTMEETLIRLEERNAD